jgi:predicted amidohydrolase
MKALLAQLQPGPDRSENSERVCALIAEHADCDLALFPELFLCGYSTDSLASRAISVSDPEITLIGDACRTSATAAVVGFSEALEPGSGRFGNSAVCFDSDGTLAGVYRKTHLFGPQENAGFEQGEQLLLLSLAGVRVGPLICFDVEFPEPARDLAVSGAELLVTIASNMDPYGEDHLVATRARALDNRRFHLYVNRVGDEAGHHFVGRSRAVAPDGTVIRELGGNEQVEAVEFDPLGQRPEGIVDYLEHLRPELNVSVHQEPTEGAR